MQEESVVSHDIVKGMIPGGHNFYIDL